MEGAEAAGAKPQRPLWASTGVKDPAYGDTLYVVELVAPDTVNTMPEATLNAVADHGVPGRHVRGLRDGRGGSDDLAARCGVDYDDVVKCSRTRVQKFEDAWKQLIEVVRQRARRQADDRTPTAVLRPAPPLAAAAARGPDRGAPSRDRADRR